VATLLDTNILLRLMQPHSPFAAIAEDAVWALRRTGESLHIAAQNLFEFWAVATRLPAENGLGLTTGQASQEIARIKTLFSLLPELPLLHEWERIVAVHNVAGKSSHDARLVAAMTASGIANILTFNVQDFTRYNDIFVLDPRTVI
jgi:predicted nucleic acid-binding protein